MTMPGTPPNTAPEIAVDERVLLEISDSLPGAFPFYGFGEVSPRGDIARLTSASAHLLDGKAGVSFRLLGNPAALLIVLFEKHLDSSMYSELGNILASKLCQRLSEKGEGDLMITPPQLLSSEQVSRLARMHLPCLHRSYEHTDPRQTVRIETLILPIVSPFMSTEGQVGNA